MQLLAPRIRSQVILVTLLALALPALAQQPTGARIGQEPIIAVREPMAALPGWKGRIDFDIQTLVNTAAISSDSGAVIFDKDYSYHSPAVAVDSNGGMHVAFMRYAHDDQKPVYYGYCPPADLNACNDSSNWTFVLMTYDMLFIQLELTPSGQPRMFMYNDAVYVDNRSRTLYRYAECNQDCYIGPNWTVIDLLLSDSGGGLYSTDYNSRRFRLDPQGRPRFIYRFGTEWHDPYTHEYTNYYMGCNDNCLDVANWWRVKLPSLSYMDSLERSVLAFTPDGRPAFVSILDYDFVGYLVYFECQNECTQPSDWIGPTPIVRMGSGPGHRSWTLQFDSWGRPRVATRPLGGPIHYMWCNTDCTNMASWQGYWIRFNPGSGNEEYPNLVLDAQDQPRMAYKAAPGGGLGYAYCESGCETMNPFWRYVTEGSDALDRDFRVPIPPDCVRGTWIGGYRPSLVLDRQGNPRISYDGEFLMECYRFPNDPNNRTTYTETKWWTTRLLFFPQPGTAISTDPVHELPERVSLDQNYPNPFNPSTTIAFSLPQAGAVRLAVYDVLGREVAVLVDEQRPAGVQEVVWNASGVPSGVYLYRLQSGSAIVTRSLTLVK